MYTLYFNVTVIQTTYILTIILQTRKTSPIIKRKYYL